MKVDLYIARQTAFRFNIAIAEPTAMKRNWPENRMQCWPVAE
jgi:hypothetical protein